MTGIHVAAAEVSRAELIALKQAEEAYREASAALTRAENAVKPLRLALAEKVLGIRTADEWKRLDPEEVAVLMARRLDVGAWRRLSTAPRFEFVKTSSARFPAWKQEFIRAKGEVEAEEIIADTPTSYSYKVEVLTGP